jgi:hypothetical protein
MMKATRNWKIHLITGLHKEVSYLTLLKRKNERPLLLTKYGDHESLNQLGSILILKGMFVATIRYCTVLRFRLQVTLETGIIGVILGG